MDDTKTEEMVHSLFTADTLIESEYLQTLRRTQHIEPEKSLMLGVLKDAIDCFMENINARNRKRMRQFKESEKWLFGKDTVWTFSFETICEILGLDPAYIRRGLRQRQKEQLIRTASAAEPINLSRRGTAHHKGSGSVSKQDRRDPLIHEVHGVQLRKAVGSL